MPIANGIRSTGLIALCLTTSFLTACASNPPVVSADTSCAWSDHIDVTDDQISRMKLEPSIWRPLALQIKGHNDERTKRCG